ncbi:MAG: phosphoribosyltransferase family protein [Candidatus Paceibacterota bacterium]
MWKTAKIFLEELLFPKICIGCGRQGQYFCDDCLSLAEIYDLQYCPYCSPPRPFYDGRVCHSHHSKIDSIFIASSYKNNNVKKALHLLKYEPCCKLLARDLAKLLYWHLLACGKKPSDFSDCLLAPVPLHEKKLRRRGYNQTQEIAKELGDMLQIPCEEILLKIKENKSQTELNRLERMQNVEGCYALNEHCSAKITGKNILLLDDIFTTGATMEECAKTLKTTKAKSVWAIAVAREF